MAAIKGPGWAHLGVAGPEDQALSFFLIKIGSAKRERKDGVCSSGASSDTFPSSPGWVSQGRDILAPKPISSCGRVGRGWMQTPAAISFVADKPPQWVQKVLGRNGPNSAGRVDNNQPEL